MCSSYRGELTIRSWELKGLWCPHKKCKLFQKTIYFLEDKGSYWKQPKMHLFPPPPQFKREGRGTDVQNTNKGVILKNSSKINIINLVQLAHVAHKNKTASQYSDMQYFHAFKIFSGHLSGRIKFIILHLCYASMHTLEWWRFWYWKL